MKKILCMGELLLRLPPARHGAWLQQQQMPVFVGGAELNVARALAFWGQQVGYATALPDHILTHDIIQFLQDEHIDTTYIHLGGDRIGLYYLQQGADLKSAGLVFDRKHSSFSMVDAKEWTWDDLLADVDWVHASAIAPAVGAGAADAVEALFRAAHQKRITVSFDLNARDQLWQYGQEPVDRLPSIMQYVDIVMGNIWSAERLLGIAVPAGVDQLSSKQGYKEASAMSAKRMMEIYPSIQCVAHTFRFDDLPQRGTYFGVIHTSDQSASSPTFRITETVERVGSGDSFMAGLIYQLRNQASLMETISFASAAAVLKLGEQGDVTRNSIERIMEFIDPYKQSNIPHSFNH